MHEKMKSAALHYWNKGLNIVPVKNKKPLIKWDQLQVRRQTEEEFNKLPWNEADGFAVVCGIKTDNGYFCAVDYDVKNLSNEIVEKGKNILKDFLTTQTEKTPSGGLHLIFWSKQNPKTISSHHNVAALELLGKNKLCIMAPSQGYTRLNDNSPRNIPDLEFEFLNVLEQNGIEVSSKTHAEEAEGWFELDLKGKYKGRNPPCINALFRGTNEGLRNEHCIRLSAYLLNFRRYQPSVVLKLMKKWNKLNTPALEIAELETIMKSVIQGQYVYGCNDPILQALCVKDECPIAPKITVLTLEQKQRSFEILAKINFLDMVLRFGRKRLIGEDNALLINFIELCSGQTKYPISGMIEGFSGSGKNESLRAIKPLIPKEWIFEFTIPTAEAVKYIPEEFHGTLLIYEASGVQSKSGTLSLRAIGEGESIETIYPARDETTGKMTLVRHKTNAKNFITTESDISVQPQKYGSYTPVDICPDLYRRVFKYSMSHATVLTKRVLAKDIRQIRMPSSLREELGLNDKFPCTQKEFQNALRMQDWTREVIVFEPSNLLKLLDYATTKEQQVALRTQHKKIGFFIQVLALLRQKNRVRFKIGDHKYVIANPEDYNTALKILQTTIMETISRIGKRQREVLDLFEKTQVLDKHKVSKTLKVSTVTAARALKSLSDHGYLKENKSLKPYGYEVLREKANHLIIFNNTSEYSHFYRKELETFLKHTLSPYHKGGTPKKIEIEGVVNLSSENNKKTTYPTQVISDKAPFKPEINIPLKTTLNPLLPDEMTSLNKLKHPKNKATPNKNLIPCPFCASFNKQMLFNSQHDLNLHIQRLHCGYPVKKKVNDNGETVRITNNLCL